LSVADQSSYDGEWRNGLPHGIGIITYKNGTFVKGNFLEGELVKILY